MYASVSASWTRTPAVEAIAVSTAPAVQIPKASRLRCAQPANAAALTRISSSASVGR